MAVIFLLFTAGLAFTGGTTEKASVPEAEERVPVTYLNWRPQDLNYLDGMEIGEIIGKKLGLKLIPLWVAFADLPGKLATLIASGETPNIFRVPLEDFKAFAEGGVLHPLDDLLKEHGTNILNKYLPGSV